MKPSAILITGAAGWIGRFVSAEANKKGIRVFAIDRINPGLGPWDVFVPADIVSGNMEVLVRALSKLGVGAVIHCAGYAHRTRETPEDVERFDQVNRVGTLRTIDLARMIGASRFVYVSSIAFYDWSTCKPANEASPTRAATAYASSKLAGETVALDSGLDCRVARLATVFGRGDRANFARLSRALASRRFVVPGDGSARKSVIPVDLVAELLVDLACQASVPHRVVNFSLPAAPALGEICDTYSEVCGFPFALRVPIPLLTAAATLGDWVYRVRPSFPFTRNNLRKLTVSTVVNVDRMKEIWPERVWPTFRQALQQHAEHYRSQVAGKRALDKGGMHILL